MKKFDNELRSYLTDEDRQEIAEEFYAKGIEQGREEEKIETARRFKNLGVPAETISTATGLSTEAIAAL
jgi:predicted transposase/invertase (TIGR01784 family)